MDTKTKINCPVCGSNKGELILKQNKFYIIKCLICDLQFVWPPPNKEVIKKTYSKKYFIGNTQTPKGYMNYNRLKNELFKEANKKIKLIERYCVQKNLLDIGCGTGIFLEEARKHGYIINGNEISPYPLTTLKQKNIICFPGPVESGILPKDKFDVITVWDVLEHIPEIRTAFKEIAGSLKKGGFLFITTPNTQSVDSILMGKSWYNYQKAPEHLLFLNKKSISKLLENSKLKLISVKPWGFYRNLSFLIRRLQLPPLISGPLFRIIDFLKLSELMLFFPFTDFLIVAQKK